MSASVTLTGADDALRALIEKTKKLGGAQALRVLSGRLAVDARKFVEQSFASSTSPDGESWKPLRSRKGQPLVKSGKLSRSIKTRVSSKGFELYTNVPYAAVHQFGASTKARWQARTKTGRFKSKKSAEKAKGRSVSVGRVSGSTIPARPFFPGDSLPASWRARFEQTTREYFKEFFDG